MTSTRWWAPANPHIGPDDTDSGMLTGGGGNPRLDLGAALIAAHRVGAAALEDAARTPLVDSGTVIQKLADARARLGIPLSESVSKSVGDRRYAMVLVRDLLDDADMAAHDLFRAAVAKRVAPSVAAQRAAAVYGVDARGMGQYRTLAIDPRANPQAVTDTADRVLFEHIEKIVTAEADDREEVSKAPAAEQERPATQVKPDDPNTDYYDARDASGQFTARVGQPSMLARLRERYGIGGQQAPEVDAGRPSERAREEQPAPTPAPARGRSAAEQRREKFVRQRDAQQRRQKQTAQQSAPQQGARQQATRQQGTRTQQKLTQRQREQLTIVAPKSTAKPVIEVVQSQINHPFLERFQVQPQTYVLQDEEMLVHATNDQAMDFVGRIASAPGRVGRIGYLLEYVGTKTAEVSGTNGAGKQLTGHARAADGHEPNTEYIDVHTLDRMGSESAQRDFIEGKRREMATRNGQLDRGRLEHISVLPSNDDEGMVVVDESDTMAEGTPTVFEFVLEDAMASYEGGMKRGSEEWELDPNQAYKVARPQDWETTYDYGRGVLIKRVHLTAVDERGVHEYRSGIRKAEAEAERTLISTEGLATAPDGTRYYNVRDSTGQFTEGGSSMASRIRDRTLTPPVVPPVDAPAKQESLTERRRRRQQQYSRIAQQRQRDKDRNRKIIRDYSLRSPGQAQRPQQQRPQQQQRGQQTLGQKIRQQQLSRIVRQVVATGQRNTVFNDHTDYAVLSEREARSNFGLNPDQPNSERTGVTDDNIDYLTEIRDSGDNISGLVAEQSIDPLDTEQVAILDYPTDDESQAGLTGVVDRYLQQDDVGLVVAKPMADDMVEVRVNRKPTSPVIVVEFSQDYDMGHYSSEGMALEFASRSTVLHDEQLDDGTVRSYRVPILRYLATPSRNTRGRR